MVFPVRQEEARRMFPPDKVTDTDVHFTCRATGAEPFTRYRQNIRYEFPLGYWMDTRAQSAKESIDHVFCSDREIDGLVFYLKFRLLC